MRVTAVEIRTVLEHKTVVARLQAAFDQPSMPAMHWPIGAPVAIGIFNGSGVTLKVIDTGRAGWLAPVFHGVVRSGPGETRLVGTIDYDRATVLVVALVGVGFLTVVGAVMWSIAQSLFIVSATVFGAGLFLTVRLGAVQKNLGERLRERIDKAVNGRDSLQVRRWQVQEIKARVGIRRR